MLFGAEGSNFVSRFTSAGLVRSWHVKQFLLLLIKEGVV